MIMMSTLLLLTMLVGVSLGRDKAVSNCMYQVYQNRGCPGNDLKSGVFNDVTECFDVCDVTDNCVAFVWNKGLKKCFFKKICGLGNVGTTKSPRSTDVYAKPAGVYKVQLDINCFDHTIGPAHELTVQECMKKCDETHGCVGFSREDDKCRLKHTCNAMSQSNKGKLFLNPLGQFQYIPGNDCKCNDIQVLKDKNPGTCKQACLDTKDCVAVVMNPTNGDCVLKHICTRLSEATDQDIYLLPACIDQLRLGSLSDTGADATTPHMGYECEQKVGGSCKFESQCEDKICNASCGGKEDAVCCCKASTRKECKEAEGTCRDSGQCETDETKCGLCGKNINKVCCC